MILVITEQTGGRLRPISYEMIAFGQKVGHDFNQPLNVVVLGPGAGSSAEELKTKNISRVLTLDHPELTEYSPEVWIHVLRTIVEKENPFLVVAGHTTQGMDFVPRLAAGLRRPLIAGCVEYEKQGDNLILTRQIFNAKLNMKAMVRGAAPYFATISPGAFSGDEVEAGGGADVASIAASLEAFPQKRKVVTRTEGAKGQADLSSAPIIVAGGRGIKQKENFNLIFELAESIGGSVGASRPVVDSEWLPREYQIGSSGQTVSPKLYIGVGISGAIQHLVGMQTSRCIVAINKDPDAPIFKVAHYGIVDDLFKVVPELTKIFKDLKHT